MKAAQLDKLFIEYPNSFSKASGRGSLSSKLKNNEIFYVLWVADKFYVASKEYLEENGVDTKTQFHRLRDDDYDRALNALFELTDGDFSQRNNGERRFEIYGVVEQPRIFGTRFWGFTPQEEPFVGFVHQGTRDKLAKNTNPGDLILVLATKTKKAIESERGRLLGLIEFDQKPVWSEDLFTEATRVKSDLFENGEFKWPFALPALKAWTFDEKPVVNDVIGRQLSMAAITDVDELSAEEARRVLELRKTEVVLPRTVAVRRDERKQYKSSEGWIGTEPGFPPSEWSKLVSREDGPTWTYLLRFGDSNVWKIGISQNVNARVKNLNFSVPYELLESKWEIEMTHRSENGARAYEFEQYVLHKLSDYRGPNERVRCDKSVIENVWYNFVAGKA